MANEEHLAILKQGVEVWNGWRLVNKDIQPDLSLANLAGATSDWATRNEARAANSGGHQDVIESFVYR